MIRCTIQMIPGGDESRAYPIGVVEITNLVVSPTNVGEYGVILKKTPPFTGALRAAWRRGRLSDETEEVIVARVGGHHRTRRGVYDLLYRALRACGLEARNP